MRALEAAGKVTSLKGVDIVADEEALTLLRTFIKATAPGVKGFRLELKTVGKTLFIHKAHQPGSSQAGPPTKKTRHDPSKSPPDWAPGVFGHMGTREARLPYSGGHYRLVRYRLGHVVIVVRLKVDLVDVRKNPNNDPPAPDVDPLRDVQPTFLPRQEGELSRIWKTTVIKAGTGSRPGAPGVVSVRYSWQDVTTKKQSMVAQMYWARLSNLVDIRVSYPDLRFKEGHVHNMRNWYTSYEKVHKATLDRMAGLLKYLQDRTAQMGDHLVLVADPAQICFALFTPVIKMSALPEDVVLKFWGHDKPREERDGQPVARDQSSPDDQSVLSDLSSTPSLPERSDIAKIGPFVPDTPQAAGEARAGPSSSLGFVSHSPKTSEPQQAQDIDTAEAVQDWNKAVDHRGPQSAHGTAAGYEAWGGPSLVAIAAAASNLDGNRSPSLASVMLGESAFEGGTEGADGALNNMMLNMNRPGVMQERNVPENRLISVGRSKDSEVLWGPHSLLMTDRRDTGGMHESSDDEFPPRSGPRPIIDNHVPANGRNRSEARCLDLRSVVSTSPFVTAAATPPGAPDYDSEGNMVSRELRNRDDMRATDDERESVAPRNPEPQRDSGPPQATSGPYNNMRSSGRGGRVRRRGGRPPVRDIYDIDGALGSSSVYVETDDEDDPTSITVYSG
jgi:hypothetical protein